MPALVTLVYPAADFDLDYYLNSHMARAQREWTSLGMTSWRVVKLDPSTGDTVQCIMEWDSVESFTKVVASESGIAMTADIKNYTPGTPKAYVGEVVGHA